MSKMEVLVLGLCRTGTMSMKLALEELGYSRVYHFFEIPDNASHSQFWIEAFDKNYGNEIQSQEKSSPDWHELFQDYNAVTDVPAVCFAPELMAAFPNAKIILTTRSPESWLQSMKSTIHALHSSRFNRVSLLLSDKETKKLFQLLNTIIKYYFRGDVPKYGLEAFEEHNALIKKLALDANRDLLEFRLGDDWEPLCRFLGKPIPEIDFPHVNDSDSFRRSFGLGWNLHSLI
ncbi:uncharacterized protein LY89DRAFT_26481 [Mollisia scopiformis]|uniref:Sulfotransferase n=1 Tax=Mollisia scopiformis TaxID=149040 RepID=A0A194XWX7_MOLSC|nr:uncharacterized protein LY89DRAFT_26481 [Mollisia scopiformis]KUJ24661.1 hypothetical protein LY89DRAFT_26481 [Mollisia scopiformis]